jgi:hypothetical protein
MQVRQKIHYLLRSFAPLPERVSDSLEPPRNSFATCRLQVSSLSVHLFKSASKCEPGGSRSADPPRQGSLLAQLPLFASLGLPSALDFAFTDGWRRSERTRVVNRQGRSRTVPGLYQLRDRRPRRGAEGLQSDRTSWNPMLDFLARRASRRELSRGDRAIAPHRPAVVLVFSEAANTSDEIKKELSLASRYQVQGIAH